MKFLKARPPPMARSRKQSILSCTPCHFLTSPPLWCHPFTLLSPDIPSRLACPLETWVETICFFRFRFYPLVFFCAPSRQPLEPVPKPSSLFPLFLSRIRAASFYPLPGTASLLGWLWGEPPPPPPEKIFQSCEGDLSSLLVPFFAPAHGPMAT